MACLVRDLAVLNTFLLRSHKPIPTHKIDACYIEDRIKHRLHRLAKCSGQLDEVASDPYLVLEGVISALKATIEHSWRMLCHQATGQETGRYIRDSAQFPMSISAESKWRLTSDRTIVNQGLKNAMEELINDIRPVIHGHKTVYSSISNFWIMVLQDLRDISAHRDDMDEELLTVAMDDLNPSCASLYIPTHGHFKITVDKCSSLVGLDMNSRTRTGTNFLVAADARVCCKAVVVSVQQLLKSFRDMALKHL